MIPLIVLCLFMVAMLLSMKFASRRFTSLVIATTHFCLVIFNGATIWMEITDGDIFFGCLFAILNLFILHSAIKFLKDYLRLSSTERTVK